MDIVKSGLTEANQLYDGKHLAQIEITNVCFVEYIWIQRTSSAFNPSSSMRSKTRILHYVPKNLSEIPEWSGDALSLGQGEAWDMRSGLAAGRYKSTLEIVLAPIFFCKDPFRGGHHILVLCECVLPSYVPVESNSRAHARALVERVRSKQIWIGFEQELTLMNPGVGILGWHRQPEPVYNNFFNFGSSGSENPNSGNLNSVTAPPTPSAGTPTVQPPTTIAPSEQLAFTNYCGSVMIGRTVLEGILRCCVKAGLNMYGCNSEVLVGAVEFQLAPHDNDPLKSADELWMARYISARVAEANGLTISFSPAPFPGEAIGLHINVSTIDTRTSGTGIIEIESIMEKLSKTHKEHMNVYGPGNQRRLLGKGEVSSFTEFSWGYGARNCSVRVPSSVQRDRMGYFEDRRPSSSCDPYLAIAILIETIYDLHGIQAKPLVPIRRGTISATSIEKLHPMEKAHISEGSEYCFSGQPQQVGRQDIR